MIQHILLNSFIGSSSFCVESLGFSIYSTMSSASGKEGKMWKNWCLQTVVLKKTPENSLDSKEIKPVDLKCNQPLIFLKQNLSQGKKWKGFSTLYSLGSFMRIISCCRFEGKGTGFLIYFHCSKSYIRGNIFKIGLMNDQEWMFLQWHFNLAMQICTFQLYLWDYL